MPNSLQTPTMPAPAHTPTPWKVRGSAGFTGHGVDDANGRSICAIPSNGKRPHAERDANAAYIVTCVNAHQALIDRLTELRDAIGPAPAPNARLLRACDAANVTLMLIKAGQF